MSAHRIVCGQKLNAVSMKRYVSPNAATYKQTRSYIKRRRWCSAAVKLDCIRASPVHSNAISLQLSRSLFVYI